MAFEINEKEDNYLESHKHCINCFRLDCSYTLCIISECRYCLVKLHSCKVDDHYSICSKVIT